jgi:hypothetical protein
VKLLALRKVAFVLLAVAAACAEDETQWNVRYAPEFPKTPVKVSILGVFRDGRMNAEAWDELGAKLSSSFGPGTCPIAYDKDLVSKNEDFANAVDDYARANGVTDGLLDKLAPAASGDEVLVFTIAGRPRTGGVDGGASAPQQAPMAPPTNSGGMRGGRSRGMGISPMRMPERNAFEVSASLFSTRDHHSVALVAMDYSGSSAADALAKFEEKMRTSLPGASCAGWHWDVPTVNDKAIRDIKEDE